MVTTLQPGRSCLISCNSPGLGNQLPVGLGVASLTFPGRKGPASAGELRTRPHSAPRSLCILVRFDFVLYCSCHSVLSVLGVCTTCPACISSSNICRAGVYAAKLLLLQCSRHVGSRFLQSFSARGCARGQHSMAGAHPESLSALSLGRAHGKASSVGSSKAQTFPACPAYEVWLFPRKCRGILRRKFAPPNRFPRSQPPCWHMALGRGAFLHGHGSGSGPGQMWRPRAVGPEEVVGSLLRFAFAGSFSNEV